MRTHTLVALLVTGVCFAASVGAGNASSGASVGFARVSIKERRIDSFGGKGTKSVTAGPTASGVLVIFNGKYPKSISREHVIVQATAEGPNGAAFSVANAVVSGASQTQIIVTVNGWVSNDGSSGTVLDGIVFLSVFAGRPPVD